MSSIVIIGELNLDLIVTGATHMPRPGEELIVEGMVLTLGSSSAIAACQLAALGDDVLFISKVGGDDFGRRAFELLQQKKVKTEAVKVDSTLDTGLTISVALAGERSMLTLMGCIDKIRYEDIDFELLRDHRHLHISSFFLQRNLRPDIWRIFKRARKMGLTTSLDTGWPYDDSFDQDLSAVWPYLDVLLPNETEVKLLSRQSTIESALSAFASHELIAAVKLGSEGAMAQHNELVVRRPGFVVEVVDTTGAGDSFNGGFLHGYLAGLDLGDCLDLGNACGALSTRAPGGTTSQATLKEAMEFIKTAARRG